MARQKSSPVITSIAITPESDGGGQAFVAKVITSGFPNVRLAYQWRLDGIDLAGATGAEFLNTSAGQLTVVVTASNNKGQDIRESAAVTVGPALETPQMIEARVTPTSGEVGQDLTAIAEATGIPTPDLTFQWIKDGAAVFGSNRAYHTAVAAGDYSVMVTASNSQGSSSVESAPVAVAPALTSPVVQDVSITPTSGRIGDAFTASAAVTAEPVPTLSYQWMLDGVEIAGATTESYVADAEGALSVRVNADNSEGSDSLESTNATVDLALTAPVISSAAISPASGRVGDVFTAAVDAIGEPAPNVSYRWFLDGGEIAGATGATYTANTQGALSLEVIATNSQGSANLASAPVSVLVALVPPLNLALPAVSGTAQVGQTLTVVSDGDWSGNPAPTLTRQWLHNGAEIAGATGTTYAVQASDAGTEISLQVTASNSEGSEIAESAVVAAPPLAAPQITSLGVSPSSGRVGDAFTAGLTVTGNPASSITRQWRLDGVDISGATEATYVAEIPGDLSFFVTTTNTEGSVTQESTAVTVAPSLAAPVVQDASVAPASGRVGDTFTASAAVTGEPVPTLSYQWMLDGVEIAGATTESYVADAEGALSVRVNADNSEGSDSLESTNATVDLALTAPVISSAAISPASGRVGDVFTAAVDAIGEPAPNVSYRWFLDGGEIAGATGATYTANTQGALSLEVIATNSQGSANLASAPVSVLVALVPPLNLALPAVSGTAQVGQTLTVVSDGDWSGNPAPTLTRQWLHNGAEIAGATGTTYAVQASDAGTEISLQVTASNSEGSEIAESAVVAAPPLAAPQITSLGVSPSSGRVGDAFTAGLTVTGNPASSITRQWRLDGVDISGATEATYVAEIPGDLSFFVTTTNTEGSVTQESTAVTVAPSLAAPVVQDASVAPASGRVGDTFTASAAVTGEPVPTLSYQWMLDGVEIAGATTESYVADAEGALSVRVNADNSEGSDSLESTNATVDLALTAPVISSAAISPASGRVGDVFTAAVDAIGEPAPNVSYRWFLDGGEIAGATGATYTANTQGALSLEVIATNSQGSANLASAPVSVLVALVPPLNLALPAVSGTAQVGQTLTVVSDGDWSGNPAPTLTRQWLHNGAEIAGATGTTYAVQASDAGTEISLQVTASNSEGSEIAESAVVAAPPLAAPQITSLGVSPSSGRVGDAFTAGLTVTGNPASSITRQWRLDGVDISGATEATYVAEIPGDLSFFVTTTNTEGSVTQESTAVTVAPSLAAPVVQDASVAPASGRVGDTFTASAAVTGEPVPTLSYQWMLDGVEIAGATTESYVADAEGALSVRVTAGNSLGTDSLKSGAATITSDQSPTVFETGIFEEGVFA